MPIDDDTGGRIFPTRFGRAIGSSEERTLLESVGGEKGIRTRILQAQEGSQTLLRTRAGNPEFITSFSVATETRGLRGFVARVVGGEEGDRFNPYTLREEDESYTPVNVTYQVLPFVSSYMVPATDTTKWGDVVSFSGSRVLINSRVLARLQIASFVPDVFGLPWIIPATGPGLAFYGDKTTNATGKRVFSVGRFKVLSGGGGGVSVELSPESPWKEAPPRSIGAGQRIDPNTNTAWIGQLFATGRPWSGQDVQWGLTSSEVRMLLTPNYLATTEHTCSVEMPVVAFGAGVASTGTIETPITLPSTEIAAYGIGEGWSATEYTYDPGGSSGHFEVVFPWRGTVSSPLPGKYHANYSRTSYNGSETFSQDCGGVTLEYTGSNAKTFDTRSEGYAEIEAITDYTGESTSIGWLGAALDADSTSLFWTNPNQEPAALPRIVGHTRHYNYDHEIGHGNSRSYQSQDGEFSIKADGEDIVRVTISREKSTGDKQDITPHLGYYDNLLADPYSNLHTSYGMGIMCGPIVLGYRWYPGSDIVPIRNYYKIVDGVQDPAAVDEINAKYRELRDALCGKIMYDDETSYAVYRGHYDSTLLSNVTEDDKKLDWTTRDYVLRDAINGVFITVDGEFSGEQGASGSGTATLTVLLRIETRYHTNTQVLEVFSISYDDLLPERILSGVSAIPSPLLRAMFLPRYQNQGVFRGAHYVEQSEEARGASPAHLFNFVLRLLTYDGIETIDVGEFVTAEIRFIPCNLLEMLYAFVFSQSYGIPLSGARYEVTRAATYAEITSTLFSRPYRVNVRDGAVVDWLDAFGPPYADDTTTELYRT